MQIAVSEILSDRFFWITKLDHEITRLVILLELILFQLASKYRIMSKKKIHINHTLCDLYFKKNVDIRLASVF